MSTPSRSILNSSPADKLRENLSLSFMSLLLSTPGGRAHVLSQCADAEATGESRIFDQALSGVDDPNLQRMISRHRDDELRHERLFRERLAATTDVLPEVPPELRVVDRIDEALGGFLGKPITDGRGVMEAYCLLQVLEERAVTQFPMFAQAFASVDPATSRVFDEVFEDEKRHLRYCVAVSRRYAPSEAERQASLERLRDIEAREFKKNQAASMQHAFKRGYVTGPRALPWKLLVLVAPLLPANRTPFSREGEETAEFLRPATAA